ncbi:MAG: hypothetical protein AAGJ37_00520 [Pseudomonadota bacterium]
MYRCYEQTPPIGVGTIATSKHKRPNCQFNELIELASGEILRNPIGLGYSHVPLTHPVVSETHLGVIEVVGLPETYQSIDKQLPRGFMPPLASDESPDIAAEIEYQH